ncbi:Kinesin motor domain/Microtubule binding, putative [Angomonas deanei]|uniref:Kinesin motor domain/Microtubule binding, putative n=1 Tax=Angomonas deanei TaxID=59799 RepID=A0A7G2CKD3_9TRYP|nr:Kinesin motor domain/Microtubule binding, putative [Angomonas deanei]
MNKGNEQEGNEEQHFSFEFVHNEDASQEEVFDESVLPFADEALLGQNIAILCYGPTGSGKTFSMMGDQQPASAAHGFAPTKKKSPESSPLQEGVDSLDNSLDFHDVPPPLHNRTESTQEQIQEYDAKQLIVSSMGILPRLATVLLEHRDVKTPMKKDSWLTLRDVTFYGVELYMDEMSDLLDRTKRRIANVSDTGGLGNLCERLDQAKDDILLSPRARSSKGSAGGGIKINSANDVHKAYRLARRNRVTSSHTMNDTSSRSHAIFILKLGFDFTKAEEGGDSAETTTRVQSYVAMADLAGCERVKDTRVEGTALREAQYINKSLSALSSVVLSLYKRSSHVPYRDSKLTRLLRPCLEGGRVLTLVHVSPCSSVNTINTLKFADQVRHTKVQTHAFGSKKALQDLYEGLTDPSQMMLEDAVQRSTQQYAQICAETRLMYLSRWATTSDGWVAATQMNSNSLNPVGNTSSTSSLNVSPLGASKEAFSDIEPAGERSHNNRRGALKTLVQQYAAPFFEGKEEDTQLTIRRLERERDRTVEAAAKQQQQTIKELEAALEAIDQENAQLKEENTTPILSDPFEMELARLTRETTEEMQSLASENQLVQSAIAVLRQRISFQSEVEDAIQAEIDEMEKRKDTHAGVSGAGDTEPNNALAVIMDADNDNEMREIFHEQVVLGQQMACLRMETACAQHGGKIFEGLWAHAMRVEMLFSLMNEISLMQDILLDKDALELLLADLPSPRSRSRKGAENTGEDTPQKRRRSSSSVVYSGGAEGEEALRYAVKDFLDEQRLASVVISRPDSPFSLDEDESTNSGGSRKEKEVRHRLTVYHKRETNGLREMPNPLQCLNWASPDDMRLTYSDQYLTDNPDLSPAIKELNTLLLNTIPISLVGSYASEEELQRVAVRKLLEEGILCEVCCAASAFEPLMEHYLLPGSKKGQTNPEAETDPKDGGNEADEINTIPTSNHLDIPMTTRWGRLRLSRSVKNPQQFILEFVYTAGGIPLSRKMQAAMAGEQEKRDELVDFVDKLPSSLNLRRGVTPSANTPSALNPPGRPTVREHRLFAIPLAESELQLNLHVLEAGVARYTPTVSTATGAAARRVENGGQVVLEVLGVPLPSGEPMVNAFVNQRAKSNKNAAAKGKHEDTEAKVHVLSKKLTNGGELLLPSQCTLGSRGACSVVLRFPSPTFTNLTRTESMEVVVAALGGLLPPTFAAATPHSTPRHSSTLNPRNEDVVAVTYPHVPYVLLESDVAPTASANPTRSFSREMSGRPRRELGNTYSTMMALDVRNKLEPSPSMNEMNADANSTPAITRGAALEIKFYLPSLTKNDITNVRKVMDGEAPKKVEASVNLDVNNTINVSAITADDSTDAANSVSPANRSSVRDRLLVQQRQRKAMFSGGAHPEEKPNSESKRLLPNPTSGKLDSTNFKEARTAVEHPVEREVRAAAQLLHQLRAVTIHSPGGPKGDRLSRWSAHVGRRLHQLQQFRRGVRAMVKQQIYEAEDLSEVLGVQDVMNGRGADVQDIEREARAALDLTLPESHALMLTSLPPAAPAATSTDGNSPFMRSDVAVHEARELGGRTVPWTLWHWAYRWPVIADLYQREADGWEQTEAAPSPSASAWASPSSPAPIARQFSSSSDELFSLEGWRTTAERPAPRTVWMPELHFATVPPFLEWFVSRGENNPHNSTVS